MSARAGLMLVCAALLCGCGRPPGRFDKAIWAAERGNYAGDNRRAGMIASLAEAGVVPGATRGHARALLGPPDSAGREAEIYYLGRSAYGPSFETFRIDYGRDGRVAAVAVRRD